MPCTYTCASHGSPARTRTPPWVRTRYLRRPGRPIHASTASSIRTALVGNDTAAPIIYMCTSAPLTGQPTTCSIQNVFARFAPAATTTTKYFYLPVSEVDEAANVDFAVTIADIFMRGCPTKCKILTLFRAVSATIGTSEISIAFDK